MEKVNFSLPRKTCEDTVEQTHEFLEENADKQVTIDFKDTEKITTLFAQLILVFQENCAEASTKIQTINISEKIQQKLALLGLNNEFERTE